MVHNVKSSGALLNAYVPILGHIKENTVKQVIFSFVYLHLIYINYYFLDINTNALTFTHPESYLKQSFLSTDAINEEGEVLKGIFKEQILINLRTYDTTALILYANDHLNNFVHLYIKDRTQVVYLFNYDNEIYNITVDYAGLNTSKSVQLAILRGENTTTLHVNDKNCTITIGVSLLDSYSNKPWINPEEGMVNKIT